MNKISTNYTHMQVEQLVHAALQAVSKAHRAFEADSQYANEVNNSDGVGITFDYYSAAPLPSWVPAVRQALAPFRTI